MDGCALRLHAHAPFSNLTSEQSVMLPGSGFRRQERSRRVVAASAAVKGGVARRGGWGRGPGRAGRAGAAPASTSSSVLAALPSKQVHAGTRYALSPAQCKCEVQCSDATRPLDYRPPCGLRPCVISVICASESSVSDQKCDL